MGQSVDINKGRVMSYSNRQFGAGATMVAATTAVLTVHAGKVCLTFPARPRFCIKARSCARCRALTPTLTPTLTLTLTPTSHWQSVVLAEIFSTERDEDVELCQLVVVVYLLGHKIDTSRCEAPPRADSAPARRLAAHASLRSSCLRSCAPRTPCSPMCNDMAQLLCSLS